MIQLTINTEIEKVAEDYRRDFLCECKTEITKNLKSLLCKLDKTDAEYTVKKKYIDTLLLRLEDIIILKPNEMKSESSNYILPINDRSFYKDIVEALLYKKVRKNILYRL